MPRRKQAKSGRLHRWWQDLHSGILSYVGSPVRSLVKGEISLPCGSYRLGILRRFLINVPSAENPPIGLFSVRLFSANVLLQHWFTIYTRGVYIERPCDGTWRFPIFDYHNVLVNKLLCTGLIAIHGSQIYFPCNLPASNCESWTPDHYCG